MHLLTIFSDGNMQGSGLHKVATHAVRFEGHEAIPEEAVLCQLKTAGDLAEES